MTTVINGKVYYGGGQTDEKDTHHMYIVYCYDPLQDEWTTLPPLPVRWFGLGQVNGELVAVGGWRKSDAMDNVYTYDDKSQKWKQTIPPMPTAKWSISVLSLQSALLVAGGITQSLYTAAVEIFKPDTSQWYRTDPLPTSCCSMSLSVTNNTCYAIGGYDGSPLNQALYVSVDDLLDNAVPANQTTPSGSNDTQSAWKTLPNAPIRLPVATVLATGSLFALGGRKTLERRADKKEIYVYSPSVNSWIHFSDLPTLRATIALAALSPTEILVIGGWNSSGVRVNTVYKGTYYMPL